VLAPLAEKTYRHFRFVPIKLRGQDHNLVQVSEFQFRRAGNPLNLT